MNFMPETAPSLSSSMEPVTGASSAVVDAESATRRVANRIIRALQHHLRLLDRAGAEFFVLGVTGNVYTVTLATAPSCTCPDPAEPCKHVLFVLLRVLGLSLDEACVWRHSLRPCQVARLVATPTHSAGDVLAGPRARERFHQLWTTKADNRRQQEEGGRLDGAACPVCLEEMAPQLEAAPLLTCGTCRNSVHAQCFARWKSSRARRAATCVVCRARWRQPNGAGRDRQPYMNLSAYMNEEDVVMQMDDDGGLCAR